MLERRTHLTNVLLSLQMLKRRLRESPTDARIAEIGLRSGRALADLLFGPDDQYHHPASPSGPPSSVSHDTNGDPPNRRLD